MKAISTYAWLCLWMIPAAGLAQERPAYYEYARPGLNWYTIETEHFKVHFHLDQEGHGSSRTARVVARVAEDIYGPITSLYEYEPDAKVSFVLKDYEDYSNGAAYFFDNMIDIWAPALDSPLRGDHNWLRNVITHEFTHMVQVQKSMKASRKMPFLYFQLLDYEDVRRPDVLYGYPNVIATYPIPVLNNPAWLAEGTAQFQRMALDYDRWDTHRDMVLRTRVLAGKEMSLADMGGFYSHTSLMREGVYNQGYAFTQYLANTYGEEALRTISEALGKWNNWSFEQAAGDALGVSGAQIYAEWMTTLRREYEARTATIRADLVEGEVLETEGFSNYYPRYSPDGRRLAYLSNKGEDFNLMSLYLEDVASGETQALNLDGLKPGAVHSYTCSLGHRLTAGTNGAFSWRPDGQALLYARVRDTKFGSLYSDLYELDLNTRKETRLTVDQRAAAPAYAPDGARIAFVGQQDGSTNLYVLEKATGTIVQLTHYQDGTQVTEPRWHPGGQWIYYGRSGAGGRDLYRVGLHGTREEVVLATDADERSPAFDTDGTWMYFASDVSGIFNLYRLPVVGTDATPERLTNVLGGAFMPEMSPGGHLAFAQYQWDGYKIARLTDPAPVPEAVQTMTYAPPPVTLKHPRAVPATALDRLNGVSDRDLGPLDGPLLASLKTDGRGLLAASDEEDTPLEVKEYSSVFTSFSFFPVLRLDQYVSRQRSNADVRLRDRTRGETLLRNTKVGFYMASREILNGLSMLGGILVGPASRNAGNGGSFFAPTNLLKLERDIFLQFDYKKGFGFIPQRWSPQLSVSLFNIRRNVENGLAIEEFPCTACFPDTTLANLAYNLWELDIAARSKVSRSLLLEAVYRFSPYRVTTERFFSKELNQSIDASSSRYFIGRAFRLAAYYEALHPYRDADVVPEGLRVAASYEFEPSRLLDRFDVEDGFLQPVYNAFRNHRLTLDARYGTRLLRNPAGGTHGVGLRLRASTILGGPVDDFFDDYVGGLIGARGYPFYALGGNETLWLQASYYLPLLPRIRKQVLFAYVDKLYARIYGDAAMAWNGAWPGLGAARKDVGAELRLGIGSFYLLPTAVFLSATYGLDPFDFKLDEGFVTPDGSDTIRYGRDLQWHFGVLFGFDSF